MEQMQQQKQHIAEDDWAELKRQIQELTFEDVFKALGGVPKINKVAPPPPPAPPPGYVAWYNPKAVFGVDLVKPTAGDPDGPLVPLPKPVPTPRTISAPQHDFIGELYKPYEPIA